MKNIVFILAILQILNQYIKAYIVFQERIQDLVHIPIKRDLKLQFIKLTRKRHFYMRKNEHAIDLTYSPEINYFLPDSHPTTNYQHYLSDIKIEQWRQNHIPLKNYTFERDFKFDDFLKMECQLKVKAEIRHSLYKMEDFYTDGEVKHSHFDNEKLLQFLKNTVNLQEQPLNILVFVLDSMDDKSLFQQDIGRNNQHNKTDLIRDILDERYHEELPIYTSVLQSTDFEQMFDLPYQISHEFVQNYTNWSDEQSLNRTISQVTKYDIEYLSYYKKFVQNIENLINNKITNGQNLMKSSKTLAELLGSVEYVQFKEFWFDFQENIFMSTMLYSQLQYETAVHMLDKSQRIFEQKLVPILSKNRAGTSDSDYWIVLDFVKQYTFTLITLMAFFAYGVHYVRNSQEIAYFSRKVI